LCKNNEYIVYGRKALNNPYIKQLLKDVNYNREGFEFEELFKLSHSRVTNTEQIQTAYAMGYLKSYTVIHRDEADGYESYDRSYGINAKYIKADDFVGMQYEESMLPIVLDFDLDFFRNKNELDMLFFFSISEIIKNASVITIAREPKYFDTCRTDSSFTNQEALDILIERLECILS
jgi:hypothetical protein